MPKTKRPAKAALCPNCQEKLVPGASFCHHCGASATGQSGAIWQNPKYVAAGIAVCLLAVAAIFVADRYSGKDEEGAQPAPQASAPASPQQSASNVDLSTMTPRQAADRLFNRVMAAEERGDSQQVTQFAPMALQAYGLVERPDADLHYHLGLISLATGDIDEARTQLQEIKRILPQHLLGLHLEYRLAMLGGEDTSLSDVLKRFAAAWDAEINSGKWEYDAHRRVIDDLHKRATGKKDAN